MRDDGQIVSHMRALESEMRDGQGATYYAACSNTTLEFVDEPDGAYSNVRFCRFREELGRVDGRTAAERVEAMNAAGGVCPACGKKVRYVVFSDADFEQRDRFCERDPKKLRR